MEASQLKTRINEAHVRGEKGTGYQEFERECAECEYFVPKNSGCRGEMMKQKSRLPRNADGTVKVLVGGNCIYFEKAEGKGPWKRVGSGGRT